MRKLSEEFRRFRGQPIEVITEGFKFCGIDVESDEDGVMLVDRKGRVVRIENRRVEAVIQPQMMLKRICGDDDCDCHDHDHDNNHDHDHDRDCDFI